MKRKYETLIVGYFTFMKLTNSTLAQYNVQQSAPIFRLLMFRHKMCWLMKWKRKMIIQPATQSLLCWHLHLQLPWETILSYSMH